MNVENAATSPVCSWRAWPVLRSSNVKINFFPRWLLPSPEFSPVMYQNTMGFNSRICHTSLPLLRIPLKFERADFSEFRFYQCWRESSKLATDSSYCGLKKSAEVTVVEELDSICRAPLLPGIAKKTMPNWYTLERRVVEVDNQTSFHTYQK